MTVPKNQRDSPHLEVEKARLLAETDEVLRRCQALRAAAEAIQQRYGHYASALQRRQMNQDNLTNELDRLLSERLREMPSEFSSAALRRVRRLTHRFRKGFGRTRDANDAVRPHHDPIARIHTLPAPIQEALRRYYVFGEAEESIGFSMNLTPEEFRRLRLDARNFVLGRRRDEG